MLFAVYAGISIVHTKSHTQVSCSGVQSVSEARSMEFGLAYAAGTAAAATAASATSSRNCGGSHNGGVGCSNRNGCHIWHRGLRGCTCGRAGGRSRSVCLKRFLVEGQKPNEGIDQDTPEIANVNEEEDEEGRPDINPDEGPQRAITIMQGSYTLAAELGRPGVTLESYGGRILKLQIGCSERGPGWR